MSTLLSFCPESAFPVTLVPTRAGLALATIALLAACGQGGSGGNAAPPALPVKLLAVAAQKVPIEIETVGQVAGSKEVEVRARVEAVLDEIATLGAAYQLTAGQIRWHLLLLERQARETLDRWPR